MVIITDIKNTANIALEAVWDLLRIVHDPEVPVINVVEMGVVRNVERVADTVVVTITPTYSGCPAMDMIEDDIRKALADNGIANVTVKSVLSPAWTTDWLTDEARQKLLDYGIAPPEKGAHLLDKNLLVEQERIVKCPQCKSDNTSMTSQFGSTACKSLYKCHNCQEPFDYFKCI
jgi:ring-1,2-phenylacetyl-CoA epoxidase subunit PaaD